MNAKNVIALDPHKTKFIMSVGALVAIVSLSVSATWTASGVRQEFIQNHVAHEQILARITNLEKAIILLIDYKTSDRFTGTRMVEWVAATEKLNPNWRGANVREIQRTVPLLPDFSSNGASKVQPAPSLPPHQDKGPE